MKKYVYMIDYYDKDGRCDQSECIDVKDLMFTLGYLHKDGNTIDNVKLVENDNRWIEEDVSFTLGKRVEMLLGYKPNMMHTKSKKKRG